ncbi:Zip-domain-containing protein [Hypoxylon cercidicola]|nr:Zip-domain-containing protein [Hypoxylon cercidicola]
MIGLRRSLAAMSLVIFSVCALSGQAATTALGRVFPEATESITAVSDCHQQGTSAFCPHGTTGLQVVISATATGVIQPTYTGCQERGDEPLCICPDGSNVEILVPDENSQQGNLVEGGSKMISHFYDDVKHYARGDGESSGTDCSKSNEHNNIPLRGGLTFVILVTSFFGAVGPIFLKRILPAKFQAVFILLKQFGTGVIIATALVHLLTHAELMFANECIGELGYEGTASAIAMAGLFLAFAMENATHRLAKKFCARSEYNEEMVGILVLEAGMLLHSLLVGLTLAVAEDSFFVTLFVVILFHQMFEGIALGTRIASIGHQNTTEGVNASHAPEGQDKASSSSAQDAAITEHVDSMEESENCKSLSMLKKLFMAAAFALITPIGMAIGIGLLRSFNVNDPTILTAFGTLNALSAGILVWVGVVEMLAEDWMHDGELANAGSVLTTFAGVGLVAGMALMSFLGKWT